MKSLSTMLKKWLLTAHIVFAAIWFGSAVTFLVLSLNVLNNDSMEIVKINYSNMLHLEQTVGRFSIIATDLTGIMLAIFTMGGLFKYYWVISKEILALISVALSFTVISKLTLKGIDLAVDSNIQATTTNHHGLVTGIALQIILLATIFAIAVFRPWGPRSRRNYGAI